MSKRKALGNKARFEVFKRDKFTCQYCGQKAPEVVLNVDHIKPVAKGGTNDILNLITSCFNCNSGKSDRLLSDDTEISKQKTQMDNIQERRNQLELMHQWQLELLNIDDDIVNKLCDIWLNLTGYTVTDHGQNNEIRPLVKKYPYDEIVECMKISFYQYSNDNEESDIKKAFSYISKICRNRAVNKDKPHMKDLYYLRGILRNRLNYISEWQSIKMLENLYESGVDIDIMKDICLDIKNWTEFQEVYNQFIEGKI